MNQLHMFGRVLVTACKRDLLSSTVMQQKYNNEKMVKLPNLPHCRKGLLDGPSRMFVQAKIAFSIKNKPWARHQKAMTVFSLRLRNMYLLSAKYKILVIDIGQKIYNIYYKMLIYLNRCAICMCFYSPQATLRKK